MYRFDRRLGVLHRELAVEGSLPAILAKRRLNRGIESLAISRDFRHLSFLLQSPLDNPNSTNAVRNSRNLRLFKARLDLGLHGSHLTVVGEFVYQEMLRADFVAETGRPARATSVTFA